MPDGASVLARGGHTTVLHAESAGFDARLRTFFAYQDLGMKDASGGANVVRAVPGTHAQPHWHWHDVTFQMAFILKGRVRFAYEDVGEVMLRPGDCVYQAPRVRHREIEHSDDQELVEITAPADFESHAGE